MMMVERLRFREMHKKACCELGMLVHILMPQEYNIEQNHDK